MSIPEPITPWLKLHKITHRLLEHDMTHLDRIQVHMAAAREFLAVIGLWNEKENEALSYLSCIEKTLGDQGFSTKRADNEDIRCLLAIYFEQNVTTEKFEDFDGERWIILTSEFNLSRHLNGLYKK